MLLPLFITIINFIYRAAPSTVTEQRRRRRDKEQTEQIRVDIKSRKIEMMPMLFVASFTFSSKELRREMNLEHAK